MQSFTNSTWTVNDQVAQPDSDSMGNHGTASGKVKKRRGKARATDDDELNEMEEQMREMELDYDASEEDADLDESQTTLVPYAPFAGADAWNRTVTRVEAANAEYEADVYLVEELRKDFVPRAHLRLFNRIMTENLELSDINQKRKQRGEEAMAMEDPEEAVRERTWVMRLIESRVKCLPKRDRERILGGLDWIFQSAEGTV